MIHIPDTRFYDTLIDLSTARLDPFAPNARNKHGYPHLSTTYTKTATCQLITPDKKIKNKEPPKPVTPYLSNSIIAPAAPKKVLC
jgi:hypothetical protein